MHGNPPEPPDMSRIELEDHYETQLHTDQLSDLAAEHNAQLAAMPIYQLIVAEQARARRLHPDDHAGHPDVGCLATPGESCEANWARCATNYSTRARTSTSPGN